MQQFYQTKQVIKYALKYVNGKTLDIGAGSGKYSSMFKTVSDEYITFDIIKGERIDVVGDIKQMPFTDNEFDTIICTQVFEHIDQPFLALKDIYRILKPCGYCILTVPFLFPYHADPEDNFRYTLEGIAKMFDQQGFKIIEKGRQGKFFTVLSSFIGIVYLNPYKKQNANKHKLLKKLFPKIERIAAYLDSKIKNEFIYSNSYIITQK